jgi:hypothetical protein
MDIAYPPLQSIYNISSDANLVNNTVTMHNCSYTFVWNVAADGFNGISKISMKFNPQAGLSDS